ncbi:ATP-binding protein [Candidatus Peregrinibacteria bacterium]|nr:ATP-binding protein [Candidatus Peregrinibacteria bacterium]
MSDKKGPQYPSIGDVEETLDIKDLDKFVGLDEQAAPDLSKTPRKITHQRAIDSTRPPNEIYQGLSPHQKLAFSLDHLEPTSFSETLTGQQKVVIIKFRKEDQDKAFELIKRASASIAPEAQTTRFLGNGNEDTISIPVVLNNPAFLGRIVKTAKAAGLDLRITQVETNKVPSLKLGSNLLLIHEALRSPGEVTKEKVDCRRIPSPEEVIEEPLPFPTKEELLKAEALKLSKIPRKGPSNYLVVDIRSISSPEIFNQITDIIGAFGSDNTQIFQFNGSLVATNISERAGTSIKELLRTLSEATDSKAVQYYDRGDIKGSKNGLYIEGFPSQKKLNEIYQHSINSHRVGMNAFLSDELAKKVNIGRDASRITMETTQTSMEGLSEITEVNDKIGLNDEGGPDRVIGKVKERQELKEATNPTKQTPRLVIVEGEKGDGKSCLIEEIRKMRKSISVQFNPEKANSSYSQLQEFAIQAARGIKEYKNKLENIQKKPEIDDDLSAIQWELDQITPLTDFAAAPTLPTNDDEAQELVETILSALLTQESALLIIDDYHHIDPDSEKCIVSLLERFLGSSNNKVLISTRSEQQETTPAQRAYLESIAAKKFGLKKVEVLPTHFLKELEALLEDGGDITLSTAYQYIFYSMPVEKRMISGTDTPKTLGHGVRELAEGSGSPLEMVTNIIALKYDFDKNFIVTADTIDIRQEAIDNLKDEGGGWDMRTLNAKEVAEKLTPQQRQFLACISMIGSEASAENLETIAREVLGMDTAGLIAELREKKFLKPTRLNDEGRISHFKIRHDTLRQAILEGFTDESKIDMGPKLFNKFKDRTDIPDEIKFSLLQYGITGAKVTKDKELWEQYIEYANLTLDEATENHQNSKTFHLSGEVLGDIDYPKGELATVLPLLQGNIPIPRLYIPLAKLIVKALIASAKSGLQVGKFNNVYNVVATLETIHHFHSDNVNFKIDLNEIQRIAFEAAYAEGNPEMLERFKSAKPSEEQALMQELKLRYRTSERAGGEEKLTKIKELLAYYDEQEFDALLDATPEETKRIERLHERIQIQATILERKSRLTFDDDVELQIHGFSPKEISELERIKRNTEYLRAELERNPKLLEDIDKLNLSIQEGDLAALTGDTDQALLSLTEGLRTARKMENYHVAFTLVKKIGDLQVIKGLSKQDEDDIKRFQRSDAPDPQWFDKAIDTYSQGLTLLKVLGNETSEHNLFLRIQYLRAIAKKCQVYTKRLTTLKKTQEDQGILAKMEQEMTTLMESAFEELKFLEDSPAFGPALDDPEDGPEIAYYMTSSIGYVLNFKKTLDNIKLRVEENPTIDPDETIIPDNLKEFRSMREDTIESGIQFGSVLEDDNLEENTDKQTGLNHAQSIHHSEAA